MSCLIFRLPSTSFFLAHWMPRCGKLTVDVSLMRKVHTPFLQSFPTRLWGWGLYGSSLVTQDTMITAGPLYSWIWNWCQLLNNNWPNHFTYLFWRKEYNYTHKTYDWFVQLQNALWHKVVLLGLTLSCMTLHCFVTYFEGWEGFSLWSAVFTRNASSRSSLTIIAETQPSGSWLFYNLHPGTCCLCSSGWLPATTCPWPLHSWRSTGRAYVCVINSWEKKFINQLE